jgi:pimeloyl-ACP methyl ester carboxylesterase
MRWLFLAVLGLVLGGMLGAMFWPTPPRTIPKPASPPASAARSPLVAVTCWFAEAGLHRTRCAELAVPERRDRKESRIIHLKLVVVGPDRPGDAVVMIGGGPGDPAGIDAAGMPGWWRFIAGAPWLREREVVLFDQRGTGLSEPDLACPEVAATGHELFVADLPSPAVIRRWRDAAADCRARLVAAGVDLAGYTTDAIRQDLAAVIGELQLNQPNLIGTSFGSRVLLSYLRDGGTGTRAVVLDSVYPPEIHAFSEAGQNAADGFALLFRNCALTPSCRRATPDLPATFERVLRRAATNPVTLPFADPATGRRTALRLGPDKLIEILFYGFYDRIGLQAIPTVIAALDHGDPAPLQPLVLTALRDYGWDGASHGLYLSVECHDEFPFDPPDAIARAAAAQPRYARFINENFPVAACPAWPMGEPDPAVKRAAESDVPALLLSGQLDIATPERWAHEAARHLAHATVIALADVGHGALANHDCASRLIGSFLDHPAAPVYDDCLLAASPPLDDGRR